MEPISAARAMEWSVELEKGLRSKKPGQPIEAILAIGPQLQRWSEEASLTASTADMFGLVLGEDRMFANSILLRLADAFRSGNNYTRICVLKVFLLELGLRKKKGKHYKGILAKQRVPNHLELLKRVKIVFDTGDVESRALALRLLGCMAHLGKDSTEILHMILSTLESCHVLEVKASLFAAGCFCELSETFAHVILNVLVGIVTSSKICIGVKVAALHVFGKMGCSSSIASRAYKIGKRLVMDSSNEEIMIEMLSSLSKLALKSMLLTSEQVDLLLSFLGNESLPAVHATALRCLGFLFSKGICCIPISRNLSTTLLNILERTDLQLNLQSEAFQIMRKVFCYNLTGQPHTNIHELVELILTVESFAQAPVWPRRHLALGLLVDISCNLKKLGRHWRDFPQQLSHDNLQDVDFISNANSPLPLPWRIALLVMDHINLLVTSATTETENGELKVKLALMPENSINGAKQETRSLLNQVLLLVKEYPVLGLRVLDRIRCLIEVLVKMWNSFDVKLAGSCGNDRETENPSLSNRGFLEFKGKEHISIISDLLLTLCRFSGACLEILDEAGAVNRQVHDTAKVLAEIVGQSGFFSQGMCTIFSLVLCSCCVGHYCSMVHDRDKDLLERYTDADFSTSRDDCWVIHEKQTLKFANKMVTEKEFWVSYKVGKYAACQGAWFTAKFTFGQLLDRVGSDSCHYWLKSLVQWAGAESEIQLLLYPKQGMEITYGLTKNEDTGKPCSDFVGEVAQGSARNTGNQYGEKFTRAYNTVCDSEKTLAMAVSSDNSFYFQRWFLNLRAKVLEVVVDILGLLNSSTCDQEKIENAGLVERSFRFNSQNMQFLIYHFTRISFRLQMIAKEFDLLATSFMDIDSRSFKSILRLALDCSLLAFCTAYVIYFPSQQGSGTLITGSLENSEKFLRAAMIQDIVERLWHLDDKLGRDLQLFLTVVGEVSKSSQSRTRVSSCGYRERATLVVCRFAVSGVLRLQEEVNGSKDEMDLHRLRNEGLKLLANIVMKWNCIPSQTPRYFFRVRPCIGAELFASNVNNKNSSDGISIPPGFHLSLNLCIQLKNLPPKRRFRKFKIYSVLAVSPSNRLFRGNNEIKGGERLGFCAWKMEEMVDLNEELLQKVRYGIENSVEMHKMVSNGGWVKSFVCFEASERGQGFSTCLLDVSTFAEGFYQITWHSCCIDNRGSCWSLLPLNSGPVFSISKSLVPPV